MADITRIIAPSPTELEAWNTAEQHTGRIAHEIECNMVEAFAAAARAALDAAYPWSGKPPVWLPLTRRTDPTIGRKRRTRRARGRRIAARHFTLAQMSHCADTARPGIEPQQQQQQQP